MKKKIVMALLSAVATLGYAQDQDQSKPIENRKHELRIDALEALIFPALDISYEYVISKYSGVGITGWVSLDGGDDDIENYQKFAITPYFRQYFFNKKDYGARGFYAEGLLQFAGGDDFDGIIIGIDSSNESQSWTNFGIGFGLGQKWVSNNGFILDLNIGGGRYIGSNDNGPDAFFRGGIGVGYRF